MPQLSNTRRADEDSAPRFADPGERELTAEDRQGFWIGEVFYTLLRPKDAVIANMAMVVEQAGPMEDLSNVQGILGFVAQLVDHIEEESPDEQGALRGRARIYQRLNDPKDALDLPQLMPMFTSLMDGWFARPTGPRPASGASRRPASAGSGSRARTRSTPARTSTGSR